MLKRRRKGLSLLKKEIKNGLLYLVNKRKQSSKSEKQLSIFTNNRMDQADYRLPKMLDIEILRIIRLILIV